MPQQAPKLNCHFLNLIKIYKKITIKEKITDHKAVSLISSAIVGPTFSWAFLQSMKSSYYLNLQIILAFTSLSASRLFSSILYLVVILARSPA